MDTNKKYIAVISKLNRLTQEGIIKWNNIDPPKDLTAGTSNIVTSFYSAQYEEKNIGIYEERYKAYDPDYDQTYWTSRIVLAFFSHRWTEEWVFPYVSGIVELFNSVKYQSAGIDNFIDKILQDEKEPKLTLREATRMTRKLDSENGD